MKKFAIAATSVALGAIFAFSVGISSAYAAPTVDCDAVVKTLNGGKSPREVASDMNISLHSVFDCWHKSRTPAKAQTKATGAAEPSAVEDKPGAAHPVAEPPSN